MRYRDLFLNPGKLYYFLLKNSAILHEWRVKCYIKLRNVVSQLGRAANPLGIGDHKLVIILCCWVSFFGSAHIFSSVGIVKVNLWFVQDWCFAISERKRQEEREFITLPWVDSGL